MAALNFTKQGDLYVSNTITSTGTAIVFQMIAEGTTEVSVKTRIGAMDFQAIASVRFDSILPTTAIDVPEGVDIQLVSTTEVVTAEVQNV